MRAQYEVERELADRLLKASEDERPGLYAAVYRELFRRVPDHPQLTRPLAPDYFEQRVRAKVDAIRFVAPSEFALLEVGAGDCALAAAMAEYATHVYAVDAAPDPRRDAPVPNNVSLLPADGARLDVPSESVDVVYSDQVLEHLHPDDAPRHLREALRVLRPGGRYLCFTPNRLAGPHDISRVFSCTTPRGMHLKEYTTGELRTAFLSAGFARVDSFFFARDRLREVPSTVLASLERVLERLPARVGWAIARREPLASILGAVVATRP